MAWCLFSVQSAVQTKANIIVFIIKILLNCYNSMLTIALANSTRPVTDTHTHTHMHILATFPIFHLCLKCFLTKLSARILCCSREKILSYLIF